MRIPREIVYEIGEKVLYYKASMDNQRTGKLDEKWKGPYHIHDTGPNGTYKLRDSRGKLSKSYINGNLLKLYKEWESCRLPSNNGSLRRHNQRPAENGTH